MNESENSSDKQIFIYSEDSRIQVLIVLFLMGVFAVSGVWYFQQMQWAQDHIEKSESATELSLKSNFFFNDKNSMRVCLA
ncbi:MAG: hypothetical protein R2827_02005 [Bdellovibrionales bacterium]